MGYFDKFNKGTGIPFMDGREKIDVPECEFLTVRDYGFIKGEDGDFAVLLFSEYPDSFAFGNSIITSDLKQMESDMGGKAAVLSALASVRVTFKKVKSKKGRVYMGVTFTELDEIPFH